MSSQLRQHKICVYSGHFRGQFTTRQSINCDAQLVSKCLFAPTFLVGDLDPKVGHTDLVFDRCSGFISRSVHARLQVSVHSGYDLFQPG